MLLHLTNPIGKGWSYRDENGFLFVLGREHPPPSSSIIVSGDFMIVARLGKHPRGFIVEPVGEDHELVSHEGFERRVDGQIVAYAPALRKTIGAGKLTNIIYVAQTSLQPVVGVTKIKIPGVGYVKRGESKLAGVPDIKELHRSFS